MMEEKKNREPAAEPMAEVRKYSEKPARDAKANQTVLLLATIMDIPVLLALFTQFTSQTMAFGKLAALPAVILAAGTVVSWVMYFKDRSGEPLRYVMLGSFLVGWGYLMLLGKGVMVGTYIIPVMIALILYYDRKFEKRAFAGIMAFMVLRGVFLGAAGELLGDDITLASVCIGIAVTLSYNITARSAKNFDHDTIWAIKDEQAKQNRMMGDILRISEAVKGEVEHTDGLVENLRDSSQVVHSSIQEISISTQITAESVQEQTTMTSRIKDAIGETAENAKVMVEAAEASTRMVDESMDLINQMRESAGTIGETNAHVADSMSQLQDKAKEVETPTMSTASCALVFSSFTTPMMILPAYYLSLSFHHIHLDSALLRLHTAVQKSNQGIYVVSHTVILSLYALFFSVPIFNPVVTIHVFFSLSWSHDFFAVPFVSFVTSAFPVSSVYFVSSVFPVYSKFSPF